MIKWAGGLMVFYGSAHTLGALAAEGAAKHVGTWLSRDLWGESLSEMSPAMSAYWLSFNSFGPPVVLLGCTLLWMNGPTLSTPRIGLHKPRSSLD